MRLMLLALLLAVNGCAVRRAVEPQMVQNMKVEFEDEVSGSEEGFALFCVDYILKAWAADFGFRSKAATIKISYMPTVHRKSRVLFGVPPWSDDPWFTVRQVGEGARGWCFHADNLLYVTAGRYNTISVLYHELCHLNVAKGDRDHIHAGWDEWDDRAREIYWELRSKWFEWRSSGKFDELDDKVEAELAAKRS